MKEKESKSICISFDRYTNHFPIYGYCYCNEPHQEKQQSGRKKLGKTCNWKPIIQNYDAKLPLVFLKRCHVTSVDA